jgi:ketol-acid reductoisomerase
MNRDDIYFMAKQAGIDSVQQHDSDTSSIELLKRFAEIVAAKEREACAKWLEDVVDAPNWADVIRARGQA